MTCIGRRGPQCSYLEMKECSDLLGEHLLSANCGPGSVIGTGVTKSGSRLKSKVKEHLQVGMPHVCGSPMGPAVLCGPGREMHPQHNSCLTMPAGFVWFPEICVLEMKARGCFAWNEGPGRSEFPFPFGN